MLGYRTPPDLLAHTTLPWSHETRPFLHDLGTTAQKNVIEIIPAAFPDHYTVAMGITIQDTGLQRARGRWKMDPILITDEHLKKG